MIGAPFLVLGLLLTLSALLGARVAERSAIRAAVGGNGALLVEILLSPIHPATWAAGAAIVAGFFVELAAFSVLVGLLSAGTSLLVVLVGFVFIALAIETSRLVARVERRRAMWADPRPLHAHAYRPYGQGVAELIPTLFLDLSRWRDVVYVFVAFPLTILEFVAAAVLWTLALTLLSVPLWAAIGEVPSTLTGRAIDGTAVAVISGLAGIVLTIVAASVTRGLMSLHRAVVAGLLCESERRALERRVASLEVSRRAVLDVEASELRRIERDLHDGAQQRLVALAMQLGLAEERIDADPAGAKALVVDAREQARLALGELRDLVRGIAPAILLDRGLVPALSALAARSPVPTAVTSDLPAGLRLSDAVERAAYFVVAESMANVAKHAAATKAEIRVLAGPGSVVVEVHDDGHGGAVVTPGGGIAGLAGRVEALDGSLTVTSPDGGPTVVRAVLPVAAGVPVGVVPPGWGQPVAAAVVPAPAVPVPAVSAPAVPAPSASDPTEPYDPR